MDQLKAILTPKKFLAVYHLKHPDPKGTVLTGTDGAAHFLPNPQHGQVFYDLIFHDMLVPLSRMPLESLLALDFTQLLPPPEAPDFPEQCFGCITILDQTRILTNGSYNARYTRCFFDPICEKLTRKLVALPNDLKPDGKNAWLSRGYTFEQWLTRVLMIWAPLVHSDNFMVNDREKVKVWLHSMRSEVQSHYHVKDPFAALEAADDVDIILFGQMVKDGPPSCSLADPAEDLKIWEYAFWWIRILNAHFALTDMCGHYPYASEYKGNDKKIKCLLKGDAHCGQVTI